MDKLTSKDIFTHYQEMGGDLPYKVFLAVISDVNQSVMEEVLEGREFDMGCNMSRLSIVKIQRDFNRPTIDWQSSYKLRDELVTEGVELRSSENPDGEPWLVYFTDDWYVRFYWEKSACKIQNRTAYRFDATRGMKGHKTALKELLRTDSIAHLNFRTL